MSIAENIGKILDNISKASSRAKDLQNVTLVAVTKNHPVAAVNEALAAGITVFGENRVQEAVMKAAQLSKTAQWHLIGHLQTNKVKQAVTLFDVIHSVDSQRLALEIDGAAGKVGKKQQVLVQVNVAGEDSKFGIAPQEVIKLCNFVCQLEHLSLSGLMTIAPNYDNIEQVRPVFREMYQIFKEVQAARLPGAKVEVLSMGMTNDYVVAIEEGANLVRIGTGIFGQRNYQ